MPLLPRSPAAPPSRRGRRGRLLVGAAALAAVALAACNPEGAVDSAAATVTASGGGVRVAGWAWDEDVPTTSVDVHVYVDGRGAAVTRADGSRPDVAAARPGAGPHHGYDVTVPTAPGPRHVCVYAVNAPGTSGDNVALGCRTVVVPDPAVQRGAGGTWQQAMFDRVNAVRAAAGIGPLAPCPALDRVAQRHAQTMVDQGRLDHTGADGSTPGARLTAAGYRWTSVGENVSAHPDATSAQASWEASATHRANLTNPAFTHMGVGHATASPGRVGPLTTTFVQDFAAGTCPAG